MSLSQCAIQHGRDYIIRPYICSWPLDRALCVFTFSVLFLFRPITVYINYTHYAFVIQYYRTAFSDKYSPQHIHVSIEQETLLYHGHVHSLLSLKGVYERPATNIGTNDIITTMLNSTLTE